MHRVLFLALASASLWFFSSPSPAQELGPCSAFYGSTRPVLQEGKLNPTAPSFPKPLKGVVFSEPSFGTCVVRGTDHQNDGTATFARTDYSRRQAFNADNSYFIAFAADGWWHLYDARTLARLRKLSPKVANPNVSSEFHLAGDAEPQWDPADPNALYYVTTNGGTKLLKLDVRTNTHTVAADLKAGLPAWANTATHIWTKSEGSPSADGRYWAFQIEDSTFRILGFMVWDLQQNRLVGAIQSTDRPDHVSMSPSGRWVITSSDSTGTWAWSPTFGTKKKLLHKSEHSDLALGSNGADYYVAVDYQSSTGDVFFVDIDACSNTVAGTATTATQCPRTVLFPTYLNGASTALHISGKGFERPGWAIISFYAHGNDRSGNQPWYADKVVAVELKANGRLYPLAYTHRKQPTGSDRYWTEPHATVSRDWTRVAFNSNWEVDSTTNVDAYLIHLPTNNALWSKGGPFEQDQQEPTCERQAPTISVTPSASGTPGQTKTFTVSVINQDSPACEATAFELVQFLPIGWTGTLANTRLTLSPGQQGQTGYTVTSSTQAPAGNYSVGVNTTGATAVHAAQNTATYTVTTVNTACVRNPPEVSLTGNATGLAPGKAVKYSLSIANKDTAACGATRYAVGRAVPAGWTGVLSAASTAMKPGETKTLTLTVTSSATATPGTYSVVASTASDNATVHTATTQATYGIGTMDPVGCVRQAPVLTFVGVLYALNPGQPLDYKLFIQNKDSQACGTTSFQVGTRLPTGWTGTPSQGSVSVAPGQTAKTMVSVASANNSSAGTYTVTATTRSPSAQHEQSMDATHRVK